MPIYQYQDLRKNSLFAEEGDAVACPYVENLFNPERVSISIVSWGWAA